MFPGPDESRKDTTGLRKEVKRTEQTMMPPPRRAQISTPKQTPVRRPAPSRAATSPSPSIHGDESRATPRPGSQSKRKANASLEKPAAKRPQTEVSQKDTKYGLFHIS
jgi:hypothetical protein